jgi:hypothetical protein
MNDKEQQQRLRTYPRPPSKTPVLLAVDHDLDALSEIERELRKRYDQDYRVVCESSTEAATARLEDLKAAGEELALVLAEQWMPGTTGTAFLEYVRRLFPTAKRALLIGWWGSGRIGRPQRRYTARWNSGA